MTYLRNSSIDHILATSWGRKISADLVAEIEAATGERLSSVEEMREFLAIKRYRELLGRLKVVREGKRGEEALKAIAEAVRFYAVERPA